MQPPYFIPATQCVLHLALRCVGQAAYKLLRSTSATSSIVYNICTCTQCIRAVLVGALELFSISYSYMHVALYIARTIQYLLGGRRAAHRHTGLHVVGLALFLRQQVAGHVRAAVLDTASSASPIPCLLSNASNMKLNDVCMYVPVSCACDMRVCRSSSDEVGCDLVW